MPARFSYEGRHAESMSAQAIYSVSTWPQHFYRPMKMHRTLVIFATILLTLASTNSTFADQWVERMLEKREHDFGTVARGSDTIHRFNVKNTYRHTIELRSVRSSCECAAPSLEVNSLEPGQVGCVVAKFNTRTHIGQHSATITLQAAWNDNGVTRSGEAQIRVQGYVRGDITVEPASMEFGNVTQRASPAQRIRIRYVGKDDWQIRSIHTASEILELKLSEPSRTAGSVVYELVARIKGSSPVGSFRELLLIETNDGEIPLNVTGHVVPRLWASPGHLDFGTVAGHGPVAKKLVLRADKPFRITSVRCDSTSFQVQYDVRAATRQILSITYRPAGETSDRIETIRIATDLGEEFQATVTAHVSIESE